MKRRRSPANARTLRREAEAATRRQARPQPLGQPVPQRGAHTERTGHGTITSIDGAYDQGDAGRLPPKIAGRHRWVLVAAYSVSEASVLAEAAGDGATYLDHESRIETSLGCVDCEQQYGDIAPGSTCPAPAWRDE